MLYFQIPLRSRRVRCRQWPSVVYAFNRTVKSCLNQTDDRFKIQVAITEKPDLDQELVDAERDGKLLWMPVKYLLPNRRDKNQGRDKYYRFAACTYQLAYEMSCSSPVWCHHLDADDLVSNRVCEYLHSIDTNQKRCIIASHGYIWMHGGRRVKQYKGLHHLCGSCNFAFLTPKQLQEVEFSKNKFKRKNPYLWSGPHGSLRKKWKKRGLAHFGDAFPFLAIVYVRKHGANMSGGAVIKRGGGQPLTKAIAQEFGIYPHPKLTT